MVRGHENLQPHQPGHLPGLGHVRVGVCGDGGARGNRPAARTLPGGVDIDRLVERLRGGFIRALQQPVHPALAQQRYHVAGDERRAAGCLDDCHGRVALSQRVCAADQKNQFHALRLFYGRRGVCDPVTAGGA